MKDDPRNYGMDDVGKKRFRLYDNVTDGCGSNQLCDFVGKDERVRGLVELTVSNDGVVEGLVTP